MPNTKSTKRLKRAKTPKSDPESLVCKRKLDALEQEESKCQEDRFSLSEKKQLLEAYNTHGFQVFQNAKLLHKYLPNRSEGDLIGLLQRFQTGLKQSNNTHEDRLGEWQTLGSNLMGNFARDKRINFDNAVAGALDLVASKFVSSDRQGSTKDSDPDYPELIRSFSQLLMGKFPDNMTPINARISMKLYEHIEGLVNSSELLHSSNLLESGSWLKEATEIRKQKLEEAKKSFEDMPTRPQVDEHNASTFLRLPKINRIIEFLNPLRIDLDGIIDKL